MTMPMPPPNGREDIRNSVHPMTIPSRLTMDSVLESVNVVEANRDDLEAVPGIGTLVVAVDAEAEEAEALEDVVRETEDEGEGNVDAGIDEEVEAGNQ